MLREKHRRTTICFDPLKIIVKKSQNLYYPSKEEYLDFLGGFLVLRQVVAGPNAEVKSANRGVREASPQPF